MALPIQRLVCGACLLLGVLTVRHDSATARDDFRVFADYARFRGNDNAIFIEAYYSLPQIGLTYIPDKGSYLGTVAMTLTIYRGDSLVYTSAWPVPHRVTDTLEIKQGMSLVGLHSFGLAEGDYQMKILGRDLNNPLHMDSTTLGLPVRLPSKEHMILSDIELANEIRSSAAEGIFQKNHLEVIPNVEGVFAEDQSCWYYVEAYNLVDGDSIADYHVRMEVYDAVGREIVSRERPRKRAGESSVLVDKIHMGQLHTGVYTLLVKLLDVNKALVSTSGKKLFVYNATRGVDSSLAFVGGGALEAVYGGMSEEELDTEFDWARYIASPTEKEQYRALKNAGGKRRYLSLFWGNRREGERRTYLERVAYANATFSVFGKNGYKTDRGRVYIIYGPYDHNERFPNEPNSRPHEIWTYTGLQGGVMFIFVQRSMGGAYELVHSTHREEMQDEDWRRYVIVR